MYSEYQGFKQGGKRVIMLKIASKVVEGRPRPGVLLEASPPWVTWVSTVCLYQLGVISLIEDVRLVSNIRHRGINLAQTSRSYHYHEFCFKYNI